MVIFIIDILNNQFVLLGLTAITPNVQVRFGIIFDFLQLSSQKAMSTEKDTVENTAHIFSMVGFNSVKYNFKTLLFATRAFLTLS